MRLPLLAILALPALGFAQGTLTPSGAPAPSMKTLTQIEPRTPLQAGSAGVTANANSGFSITAPGSYYLAGNLTVASGDAIAITANGVSLDLNGFTIASTAAAPSGSGILINGALSDITIRNGHIRSGTTVDNALTFAGAGFNNGIYSNDSAATALRASSVTTTGMAQSGIYFSGALCVVKDCAALVCGSYGISATTVSDSSANNCGNNAISAFNASNCSGHSTANTGLQATIATNCSGTSYARSGIGLSASTASNCYGEGLMGSVGLRADTAVNCRGDGVYTTGLSATNATNCYGYINSYTNGAGTAISAVNATNCHGYIFGTMASGTGIRVSGTASFCSGSSGGFSGTAINAYIAIGCTSSGGSIVATYKYLMP